MSEPVLLVDKNEGIATLTLNRPKAMNALSRRLRSAIATAFDEVASDDDVGVVILTGAGERAFCAGLDLKELGGESVEDGAADGDAFSGNFDIVEAMMRCDRPIIGAINGFAITGGFELALACDVLIGSTGARFADTHARVGIMPGWGLSQRLSRLIGIYRAKEISLTGNYIEAEQAERWGLLNRVVEPAALMPICRDLARDMLSCEPEMIRSYKRVIDDGYAATLREGLEIETKANRGRSADMSSDRIAERRQHVQERGRDQSA